MRTRDLEAGGYYAVNSCSYLTVVKAADDGTVRADWKLTGQGTYGAGDGSQRETLKDRHHYTNLGRKREGVLVELYQYDTAGRRLGDPVQRTIVYPKDVKVPWGFYVAENESAVRNRAESFAKDRAERRDSARLQEAAKAFHPKAAANAGRGRYGKPKIEIYFESRAALDRFLEANAGAHT